MKRTTISSPSTACAQNDTPLQFIGRINSPKATTRARRAAKSAPCRHDVFASKSRSTRANSAAFMFAHMISERATSVFETTQSTSSVHKLFGIQAKQSPFAYRSRPFGNRAICLINCSEKSPRTDLERMAAQPKPTAWEILQKYINTLNHMLIAMVSVYTTWLCWQLGPTAFSLHTWLCTIGVSLCSTLRGTTSV